MAVVSQSPGNCGSFGVGAREVEVGRGICREKVRVGVRVILAMREVEMLL